MDMADLEQIAAAAAAAKVRDWSPQAQSLAATNGRVVARYDGRLPDRFSRLQGVGDYLLSIPGRRSSTFAKSRTSGLTRPVLLRRYVGENLGHGMVQGRVGHVPAPCRVFSPPANDLLSLP